MQNQCTSLSLPLWWFTFAFLTAFDLFSLANDQKLLKVSPSDAKSKIGHTVFIPLSAPQTFPNPLFVPQNQLKSQAPVSSARPSQLSTLAVSVFFPHENSGCRPWPRVVLNFYCSNSWKCPQFYLQAIAWSSAIFMFYNLELLLLFFGKHIFIF